MEAYVISLEREKEKWPKLLNYISKNGFPNVQIFKAIEGVNHKDAELSVWARYNLEHNIERKDHAQLCSWGALGCSLSHVSLWRNMVDRGLPNIAIFEDDVTFNDGAIEKIKKITRNIPADADVVFLGLHVREGESTPYNELLYKLKGNFFGTHAYIITNRGARKFINKFFPIEIQIDSYMSYYAQQHKMNLYYADGVCFQQMRVSSIQKPCVLCDVNSKIFTGLTVLLIILLLWTSYSVKSRKST